MVIRITGEEVAFRQVGIDVVVSSVQPGKSLVQGKTR